MMKIKNYINGKFVESSSKQVLENLNPATGKIINHFPNSNQDDISNAVNSAKKAFPSWKSLTQNDRSQYLIDLGNQIKKNVKELALAESLDTGKPEWLSIELDIPRAAEYLIYFGNSIKHFSSKFKRFLSFSKNQISVDLKISPETEVAEAIRRR